MPRTSRHHHGPKHSQPPLRGSLSMAARKKGTRETKKSRAAKIRARLDHPVVDADGHMLEYAPVFLDFLKQVAGPDTVKRYASHSKNARANQWHKMSRKQVHDHRIARPPFWAVAAAHTRDRATSMLPGLLRDRLDEFGFDYTIVYPTSHDPGESAASRNQDSLYRD